MVDLAVEHDDAWRMSGQSPDPLTRGGVFLGLLDRGPEVSDLPQDFAIGAIDQPLSGLLQHGQELIVATIC